MSIVFSRSEMASPAVFIMIKQGAKLIVPKTAMMASSQDLTFYELSEEIFYKYKLHLTPDDVNKCYISSLQASTSMGNVHIDSLHLPLSVGLDQGLNLITYHIGLQEGFVNADTPTEDAFSRLMQVKRGLPRRINKEHMTAPDKLFNTLLDWAAGKGAEWRVDVLDSAKELLTSLRNALWYLEAAHSKFSNQGCKIPEEFKQFSSLRDWKAMKKSSPKIEYGRLTDLVQHLTTAINLPSSNTKQCQVLVSHVELLLKAMIKYKDHLFQDNQSKLSQAQQSIEVRSVETTYDTTIKLIEPNLSVSAEFKELDADIRNTEPYQYIYDLSDYSPEDRFEKRNFIKKLSVSVPIQLYRVAYGGAVGTHNFIWKVEEDGDVGNSLDVVNRIAEKMPNYTRRAIKKNVNRQVQQAH